MLKPEVRIKAAIDYMRVRVGRLEDMMSDCEAHEDFAVGSEVDSLTMEINHSLATIKGCCDELCSRKKEQTK